MADWNGQALKPTSTGWRYSRILTHCTVLWATQIHQMQAKPGPDWLVKDYTTRLAPMPLA